MNQRLRTRAPGEISLIAMFEFVRNNWGIMALVAASTILAGTLYAVTVSPKYRASALIRVVSNDDIQRDSATNLAAFLDARSAPSAELELVRTRAVALKAVERAGLEISARPKRFPLIGEWASRRSVALSKPGLMGYGGYAWGKESITVERFDVPATFERKPFTLTVLDKDRYILHQDNNVSVEGLVGTTLRKEVVGGELNLRVSRITALPGIKFSLTRVSKEDAADDLLEALVVSERGKQSGLIAVSLDGSNPIVTAEIVNEIARQYIERNIVLKTDEAERTLAFLDSQLPAQKRALETAEAKFSAFRNIKGTADVSEEVKAALQQTVSAQIRLAELRQRRAELLTRYQEGNPFIDSIDQQIKALSSVLAAPNDRLRTVPGTEQELARLTRDIKVNSDLYASMLNTAQQLRLTKASRLGSAKLIDEAVASSTPIGPKRGLIVAGSIVLGMILAVFAGLLHRALAGAIRDQYEIARDISIPLVAVVPHSKRQTELRLKSQQSNRHPSLLAEDSSEESAVESMRSFRAALDFSSRGSRGNLILFTGPTARVGKSFIASNLSALIARSGKRVLLIDADLREGCLHEQFGLKRGIGLGECILNEAQANNVIAQDIIPGLSFMSTGGLRLRAGDALANPSVGRLLTELAQRYDYVIVDTPPVLLVADALSIASHVGLIYCVVRRGKTSIDQVREVCIKFEQSGSLINGIIFNDARLGDRTYGYGIEHHTEL